MLRILVLALGMIVSLAQAGKAEPMGTAWTYQGRLMDSNDVADGLYDFQFKLFDNSGIIPGGQVGKTLDVNDVDVIDGYCTVELDFGIDIFNGDARWLAIAVRPGKSADPNDYTQLFPRQEVAPAPYAIYAGKAGDISLPYLGIISSEPTAFLVRNTGSGKAIQGISENNDGVAGGSGTAGRSGIFGYNDNPAGFGIFGSSVNGIGVKGYTYGETGKAGLFEIQNVANENPALEGITNGTGQGVYGSHSSSGNYGYLGAESNGAYGYSESDSGVYGETWSGRGVYGEAVDSSGVNYGIYGKTNSANGYAGYFEGPGYFSGNVGIGTNSPTSPLTILTGVGPEISFVTTGSNADVMASGEFRIGTANSSKFHLLTANSFRLTVDGAGNVGIGVTNPGEKLEVDGNIKGNKVSYSSARTHYYAISGDEFAPRTNDGSTYKRALGNGGAFMFSGPETTMTAGVHLPDGAVLTGFTAYFYDNDAVRNLTAKLAKKWFSSGYSFVAEVDSSGISGYGNKTDTTMDSPYIVNNTNGAFQVHVLATGWSNAGSDLIIMGALVTYTINEAP